MLFIKISNLLTHLPKAIEFMLVNRVKRLKKYAQSRLNKLKFLLSNLKSRNLEKFCYLMFTLIVILPQLKNLTLKNLIFSEKKKRN